MIWVWSAPVLSATKLCGIKSRDLIQVNYVALTLGVDLCMQSSGRTSHYYSISGASELSLRAGALVLPLLPPPSALFTWLRILSTSSALWGNSRFTQSAGTRRWRLSFTIGVPSKPAHRRTSISPLPVVAAGMKTVPSSQTPIWPIHSRQRFGLGMGVN